MQNKEWFSHLDTNIISSVKGVRLSSYLVALEGWRRGLTLKWYIGDVPNTDIWRTGRKSSPMRLFSLSSKHKTHFFHISRGDLASTEAIKICLNKEETKRLLQKKNIPVPIGKRFLLSESRDKNKIIEYAKFLGFPLVLKPTKGSMGKGVMVNITNEAMFQDSLNYLLNELNEKDIIVEQYITGNEYRVYVVGNRVVGAVEKLPPNIIGNNKNTIKELIQMKNSERRKNPHLSTKPIKIDFEVLNCIEKKGYNLDSVLKEGEQLFLREKNSFSTGGEPIDVTNKLDEKSKRIATKAVEAIPNLYHAGIDMLVNQDTGKIAIIEINATPMIGSHLFPEKGKARDVPKAIIDFYFPETIYTERSDLYFDYNTVRKAFSSQQISEVKITPPPKGKTYAMQYKVSGKVNYRAYNRRIKNRADKENLHGFIKRQGRHKIIVVAGNKKEAVLDFKDKCHVNTKRIKVHKVEAERWDKPVCCGFKIIRNKVTNKTKINKLEKEIKKIRKENKNLKNSLSWKFTSVFRRLSRLIRGKR